MENNVDIGDIISKAGSDDIADIMTDDINTLDDLDNVINKMEGAVRGSTNFEFNKYSRLGFTLSYETEQGLKSYTLKADMDGDEFDAYVNDDSEEVNKEVKPSVQANKILDALMSQIRKKIAADRIFNSIFPVVKEDYIGQRVPVIYNQLQQIKVIKGGVATLGVRYNKMLKRYVMYYNPDFIVDMAVKEYFYSKDSFKGDFKNCYIYTLMFVLSHEMMHIIKNHTQDRVSLLRDSNSEVVNGAGDSFINIELSKMLQDNRLVNKPTKPVIGLTNETYYQGLFHKDKQGTSISDIGGHFGTILNKYTRKEYTQDKKGQNPGEIPMEQRVFSIKAFFPENAIEKNFGGNSSYFIKFYDEIFDYFGEILSRKEIKERLKKERLKKLEPGDPVRVISSGDRGVVVEKNDGIFKVAASSAAEGDDERVLDGYNNNGDITILGDFKGEELKPIEKVTGKKGPEGDPPPPGRDRSRGRDGGGDDDIEQEDHRTGPDDDNSGGGGGSDNDKRKTGISVGDTVKVNGQIGVVNRKTADGKIEVEAIDIIEFFISENFKKTGKIIGTFDPEHVSPYDLNTGSGGSGGDEDDEDNDEEDNDDKDGGGEGSDDEEEKNPPPEDDDEEEKNPFPDDDEGGDGGSGEDDKEDDDGGGAAKKSEIEKLLDDIEDSKDSTTKQKQEQEEQEDEDDEGVSRQEEKEALDKLKDDIKKAIRDASKQGGMTEEERELMQGIGADKLANIPEISKTDWRKNFSRLLSKSLNIKSTYDPNTPSRRVPDAFGSPKVEKDIKDIVLALDCSGSMGAPKFKESIKHIQTFINTLRGVNPTFHLIFWGGAGMNKHGEPRPQLDFDKVRDKQKVAQTMISRGKARSWSTDPVYMFQHVIDNLWSRPDAMIIFTDGGFNGDSITKEVESYIRRNQDRILWVLTRGATLRGVKEFDPSVKMLPRYIKQGR